MKKKQNNYIFNEENVKIDFDLFTTEELVTIFSFYNFGLHLTVSPSSQPLATTIL